VSEERQHDVFAIVVGHRGVLEFTGVVEGAVTVAKNAPFEQIRYRYTLLNCLGDQALSPRSQSGTTVQRTRP